jgi:uncharacterized protein YdeI (YjbR/CyaY-like superfamily)
MEPTFFSTPAQWRRWLSAHHATARQLWVGFWKRDTGRPSMTWPESVAEALCYGWIDGIRRSLGEDSYVIRFTPRRPGSTWSAVNLRMAAQLIAGGRMRKAGLQVYEARPRERSGYSFEQRKGVRLPRVYERMIRGQPEAWAFFRAQPPGYRRTVTWWIVSAKREDTRLKRLKTLIADSARGRRRGLLVRRPPRSGKGT